MTDTKEVRKKYRFDKCSHLSNSLYVTNEHLSNENNGSVFNPQSTDVPLMSWRLHWKLLWKKCKCMNKCGCHFVKALPASLMCHTLRCSWKIVALNAVQVVLVEGCVPMASSHCHQNVARSLSCHIGHKSNCKSFVI